MLISLWEQDSHQPHVSYTVLYVKTKLWDIYLQLLNQLLTWLGLQFGTHPSVGTDHFCTCGVSSFGVKHKHKRQTWIFGKSRHISQVHTNINKVLSATVELNAFRDSTHDTQQSISVTLHCTTTKCSTAMLYACLTWNTLSGKQMTFSYNITIDTQTCI